MTSFGVTSSIRTDVEVDVGNEGSVDVGRAGIDGDGAGRARVVGLAFSCLICCFVLYCCTYFIPHHPVLHYIHYTHS